MLTNRSDGGLTRIQRCVRDKHVNMHCGGIIEERSSRIISKIDVNDQAKIEPTVDVEREATACTEYATKRSVLEAQNLVKIALTMLKNTLNRLPRLQSR